MYVLTLEIAATMALLIGHVAAIIRNRFLPPRERPRFQTWEPRGAPRLARARPAPREMKRAA
jgi:hypothetical protein